MAHLPSHRESGLTHLAHPIRLRSDGGFAMVEQDSADDLTQQAHILVLSRPGDRSMRPDYGVPDPTFGGYSEMEVAAALEQWLPDVVAEQLVRDITEEGVQSVLNRLNRTDV